MQAEVCCAELLRQQAQEFHLERGRASEQYNEYIKKSNDSNKDEGKRLHELLKRKRQEEARVKLEAATPGPSSTGDHSSLNSHASHSVRPAKKKTSVHDMFAGLSRFPPPAPYFPSMPSQQHQQLYYQLMQQQQRMVPYGQYPYMMNSAATPFGIPGSSQHASSTTFPMSQMARHATPNLQPLPTAYMHDFKSLPPTDAHVSTMRALQSTQPPAADQTWINPLQVPATGLQPVVPQPSSSQASQGFLRKTTASDELRATSNHSTPPLGSSTDVGSSSQSNSSSDVPRSEIPEEVLKDLEDLTEIINNDMAQSAKNSPESRSSKTKSPSSSSPTSCSPDGPVVNPQASAALMTGNALAGKPNDAFSHYAYQVGNFSALGYPSAYDSAAAWQAMHRPPS